MVCVAEMVVSVAVDIEVVQRRVALVVFPDGDAEQTGKEVRPCHCPFLQVQTQPQRSDKPIPSLSRIFSRLLPISRSNLRLHVRFLDAYLVVKASGTYLNHHC
jgi:hypothetical protein